MIRLSIEGPGEADIEAWCISYLRAKGYEVVKDHQWETPKMMHARLRVSSSHLSSTLRDRRCPHPLDTIRGRSGRIIYLVSHPILDAFVRKHGANGRHDLKSRQKNGEEMAQAGQDAEAARLRAPYRGPGETG